MRTPCSIPECAATASTRRRGWCGPHYRRWKAHGDPRAGRGFAPGVSLKERLRLLSDHSGGPDSCWPWVGTRAKNGYALMSWQGETLRVSHLVFTAHHGQPPPPEKPFVLHTCDNPPCVNPKHLWAGTARDNVQDMIRKGRDARPHGERHPKAKLTAKQVRAIRLDAAAGVSKKLLVLNYHISRNVINGVLDRTRWAHVA